MNITELIYPDFVANQVLTSAHLNDLREYLDEQTRLTRANLIGVGIACGLEVSFDGAGTIHLTRGVGVTTQGYLVMEPTDVALTHARSYTLPTYPGYTPFMDSSGTPPTQYALWELFPDDDVPGAVGLDSIGEPLEDMAVVLFLELNRAEALTCSPVDCDDRGPTVTATLRRLLVDVADLDKVISTADDASASHLGLTMADRLQLPDLRMPRVDVPATGPVGPADVLFAFQEAFRTTKLAAAVGKALSGLYTAFKPLLSDDHPSDPFTPVFAQRYGFLDQLPTQTRQVLFMQYYWDLFDDLLGAYDEARWAGVDLMCVCCPPEGWFPRHLMAGVLDPAAHGSARYRHGFLRSPAVGDCAEDTRRFHLLFARLVRMVNSFSDQPDTPAVRATPSRWGQAALSDKAIPYYYDPKGNPPLNHLWDPTKTMRGRAHHNLGYRCDQYVPPAPVFVQDPLRFELEPHNFLRIEGHLGNNVREVLKVLLELRQSHRLPFQVVALRAGAFDEDTPFHVDEDDCRFEDLETLYQVLHAEIECLLGKQLRYFYALPDHTTANDQPIEVSLPLLKRDQPDMVARPGTLGHVVETGLAWHSGTTRFTFVTGTQDVPRPAYELVAALADLSEAVPERYSTFEPQTASEPWRRMIDAVRELRDLQGSGDFNAPGLADRLAEISECQLAPFDAIAEEYQRRIRKVKQALYLTHFLDRHPGIQHKAGVPLGGTFVLVHHHIPQPSPNRPVRPEAVGGDVAGPVVAGRDEMTGDARRKLAEALEQLDSFEVVSRDPNFQALRDQYAAPDRLIDRNASLVTDKVYLEAVAGLPDGAVIADFFLPYCCCSDCTPIQFTLPSPRLEVTWQLGCTNVDGTAALVLTVPQATGTLLVQVDGGPFSETTGTLLLAAGPPHTLVVRDSAGNESRTLHVTVPPALVIANASTQVDPTGDSYEVTFTITGGTAPYEAEPGTLQGDKYASGPVRTGETLQVKVADSRGCTVEATFQAEQPECDLPCGGDAIRAGHRFWLPEAQPNLPINEHQAEVESFMLLLPDGTQLDLTPEVAEILEQGPRPIRTADFLPLVRERWLQPINDLVAEHVGSPDWFRLEYEPAAESPVGTLYVERLTCLDFRFLVNMTWMQGRKEQRFGFAYHTKGTEITDHHGEAQAFLPLMGDATSNKCRPNEPPVPRCTGTDLTVEIGHEGQLPEVVFHAKVSDSESPVAFLWEVQDGVPALGGEPRILVSFDPIEPVEKLVRLTTVTKDGCVVVTERVVNLRQLG